MFGSRSRWQLKENKQSEQSSRDAR